MNANTKKLLKDMNIGDLRTMLENDPMYKQVMAGMPEDQQGKVSDLAMDFVVGMQEGAIDKIAAMAENPEFIEAFLEVMRERDPEKFDD